MRQRPWRFSHAKAGARFSAERRVTFTATRVEGASASAAARGDRVRAVAAAGPAPTATCGTMRLRRDDGIDGRAFARGTYKLSAFGISCAKVTGRYGLFDQFLRQSPTTPLPRPWTSLVAVGAPKFVARAGVGFRAQRISG